MKRKTLLYNWSTEEQSWAEFPIELWQNLLNQFMFKVADSFAFGGVFEREAFRFNGLTYFEDWQLEFIDLGETSIENSKKELLVDIVGRYRLNEQIKEKLLEFEFAVHYDFNVEFDELYFFIGQRQVSRFINHENQFEVFNLEPGKEAIFARLDDEIKKHFWE